MWYGITNMNIRISAAKNKKILENARRLAETGAEIRFRMPYVPGYNDTEASAVAAFAKSLGCPLELMAYHNIAVGKYAALGRNYETALVSPPSQEAMRALAQNIGAIYDPAAEIGDYLIGGANGEIASVLYSEVATLSAMYHGHVAAPMPEEQEDEYPYIGANVQEIQAVRLQLAGLEASAIVNVDVEYAQNQSATTAPTTGWSTDAPTWRSGFYIWQRTATMTGEGTSYSDPVCLSDQDGGIVSIVEQFYLSASDAFPASGEWSVVQPTWESGKYIWTRSQITRSNGDVSTTEPVLAKAINDTNQRVTTLDTSLNQEGIFNRLTNNGQAQGIYISNGQLYVSASYILSGILRLGGVNNGNGVLNILNSSGQVVGTWDNTGLSVNNGAFSVDTSGKLTAGNSELSGSLTCSGTYGATPGEVIIQGGSIRANKAGVEELWISGSTFMALEGKDLYFVSNYPKSPRASVTLGANGNITVNATKILLYPTTANDGGIYVAGFKGVDGDFTTADGKLVAKASVTVHYIEESIV
mgnify:CR=1 FL=1